VAAPSAAVGQAAPRAVAAEPVKDLGTVPKGEKIVHVFQVRNSGASALQIHAAKPSCGCVVAGFDTAVAPGATGRVTVELDTGAFAGPISKSVILETNDPAAASLQLTLNAIVKPYVDAYPAGYVRYNLLQGESAIETVTLYSEDPEPFRILKVESPQPWIKVALRTLEAADRVPNIGRAGQAQHRLEISLSGDKVGPLAEKIRVTTSSKHQPEYLVSVSGVVRPTFRVEPTAVNFGEVARNESAATRTIILRSNNLKTPESFVVTSVVSGVPGLGAEVKEVARGQYQVTLQVNAMAAGPFSGDVTVRTNDRVRPVFTIPVRGTAKTTP
jgi:hypothetical protein